MEILQQMLINFASAALGTGFALWSSNRHVWRILTRLWTSLQQLQIQVEILRKRLEVLEAPVPPESEAR